MKALFPRFIFRFAGFNSLLCGADKWRRGVSASLVCGTPVLCLWRAKKRAFVGLWPAWYVCMVMQTLTVSRLLGIKGPCSLHSVGRRVRTSTSYLHFLLPSPQPPHAVGVGTADAEIKVPSAENSEVSTAAFLYPGIGQVVALPAAG